MDDHVASTQPSSGQESSASDHKAKDGVSSKNGLSRMAAVRCIAAFACSHLIAPYLAARTSIRYQLEGSFETVYLTATISVLLIGAALSFGTLRNQPTGRRLLYGLTGIVLWIVVAGLQLVVAVDTTMSKSLLTLFWAGGSSWVIWSIWAAAFYRWRGIVVGTTLVLVWSFGFWQLVEVTGLTGDARVEFAWRHQPRATESLDVPTNNRSADAGEVLWPGYLGVDRAGKVSGVYIAADWKTEPPQEVWRQSCGAGWSSFAATESTLFTQEQIDQVDCVTARQISDGQLIWVRAEQQPGFKSGLGGDGPRATPSLHQWNGEDGSQQLVLYAVGPTGLLQCLDASGGEVLWEVDLAKRFPGENLPHGVCASPLVLESIVVVCPPAEDGPCLAAFDLHSGAPVWTCDSAWRSSYCSPQLMTIAGQQQIVVHTSPGVLGVDPDTGQTLWQFEWTNEWDNNATQPLALPNAPADLVIATGYRGGGVRLNLQPSSNKRWSVTEVWESNRTLRTKFCNMHLLDDLVVSLDNGILCGVDATSGNVKWKNGRYGHGQLLKLDHQLLVVAERGDVCLLEPDESGPNETARFTALDRKTWNQPVIVQDLLILRNDQQIVCYRLRTVSNDSETPNAD